MSVEETGPTGDGFEPDDGFGPLGETLGTAFRSQADRFEPSNSAYAKLAEAVADSKPRRSRLSDATGWLRPVALAAAVVATVGVGAVVVAGQGTQELNTGPGGQEEAAVDAEPDQEPQPDPSTTLPPTAEQDPVEESTAVTEVEPDEPAGDTAPAETQPGFGPIRATRLEAAQAFMDLLRLDFATPELDDDGRVLVRSFPEGGTSSEGGRVVAELAMANLDGGFAVREATTDSVFIDAVTQTPGGQDEQLLIEGEGTGFEATLDVRVMSAFDNRVLAEGFTNAGNFGELAPYRAEVDVVGHEHGWVIVSSSAGADRVEEPFAAKPISFESAPDPTSYAVIGVWLDDPDGGLVVRSGPGTGNTEVAVLPAGTPGLRRNAQYPVPVGAGTWWSVETPEGVSGWVNSRFVAASQAIDPDRLAAAAGGLRSAAELPGVVPASVRLPVAIGTLADPILVDGGELRTSRGWTEVRSFPMPEEYGQPERTSLLELTSAANWPEASIDAAADYSYPADADAAEQFFADLPSAVLAPDGPNSPWGRTFVFFESTPAGPELVGMLVEVQRP